MNNMTILKNLRKSWVFIIFTVVLSVCSCSNVVTLSQQNSSAAKSDGSYYISFNIKGLNAGRTIFPELPDVEALENIKIYRKYDASENPDPQFILIGEYEDYTSLSNGKIEISEEDLYRSYIFKVTASCGDKEFEGKTGYVYLTKDSEAIDVTLSLVSYGEGSGNINLTFNYIDYASNPVRNVKVMFANVAEDDYSEFYASDNPEILIWDTDEQQISFVYSNLSVGTYEIRLYLLHDDENYNNNWMGIIRVASNMTSSATINMWPESEQNQP